MVKLAIIGCGGMANAHAERFAAVADRMDIAAVVDIDIAKAQAVAAYLDDPIVSADYTEVLDAVDAVFLVLPHHLHHPIAKACLEAGKHVLVEKPLANTEEECLDLIDTAMRVNRTLMVAYPMRYHPMVVKLKELIDAKTYGDVFQISMWTEQYTRYNKDHWAMSAKTLGGGQLFSHGCHYIDLLIWMLGQPVHGCHMGTNYGTPWMEWEGSSHVVMKFSSGALGHHFATWGAGGTKLRYSFHVHCTGGMLEAEFASGELVLYRSLGTDVRPVTGEEVHRQFDPSSAQRTVLHAFGSGKQTDKEMIHFADCVENGVQPDTDGTSALEGLRVIWKLYEAERAGVMADLQDLDASLV